MGREISSHPRISPLQPALGFFYRPSVRVTRYVIVCLVDETNLVQNGLCIRWCRYMFLQLAIPKHTLIARGKKGEGLPKSTVSLSLWRINPLHIDITINPSRKKTEKWGYHHSAMMHSIACLQIPVMVASGP